MRAIGIDISEHQKNWSYADVKRKLDYIMIRVSQGLVKDIRFDQHYERCGMIPFTFGYHYARVLNISDPLWWVAQADFYLECIEGKSIDINVVDIEKKYNTPSMRFFDGCMRMMVYLESETGRRSMYYTNPDTYQAWLLQYGQKWMNSFPYMCSQYPYKGTWKADTDPITNPDWWVPRLPAGQKSWLAWQWSADGNQMGPEYGVKREPWHYVPPSVDLQVWNGTVDDLAEFIGLGVEEPSGPEEPTIPSDIATTISDIATKAQVVSDLANSLADKVV